MQQTEAIGQKAPLLARFLSKLILEGMPAALASVIGGFLISQFHFGYAAPTPATEQAVPVSAELVQLVRDEHARIIDYINAQTVAAKRQLAAERAESTQAAAAAATTAAAPASSAAVTAPASRSVVPRSRVLAAVVTPPHAPLVVVPADAAAEPDAGAAPVEADARESNSLLARTLDVKDRVVDTTRRVVGAIQDIPSWLAWRVGATSATSDPARPFSASL